MSIDIIKRYYIKDGLSAREIGNKLGKTTWQIIRLMKRNNIPRRTPAATQKIQFYRKPLTFSYKERLSTEEKTLFEIGLMLYWAEGVKSGNHIVDFANSNERMVLIFLTMLRSIYQVKEDKLRVLLYCYANQNAFFLKKYWSVKLNIPQSKFIKPYIRQDFDKRKIHKMPFGLVHIRYHDKKLFMRIQENIDIIASRVLKS